MKPALFWGGVGRSRKIWRDFPICFLYGVFTYIFILYIYIQYMYHKFKPNVGKYSIHSDHLGSGISLNMLLLDSFSGSMRVPNKTYALKNVGSSTNHVKSTTWSFHTPNVGFQRNSDDEFISPLSQRSSYSNQITNISPTATRKEIKYIFPCHSPLFAGSIPLF